MPTLTIAADCLLEDIPFSLEKEFTARLTIDNPKYVAAKKYGRWVGNKIKPTLKYYQSVPDGLRFPRGFANQAVLLCREFFRETPLIHDKRLLLEEMDTAFHGVLRPYQEAAVVAAEKRSFGVLEAGTGSGKTVMALAIIAARRQPTLIVVHTRELLYQWQERVREFLRLEPGLIGDGHFEVAPVSIAIVNTARKRFQELASRFGHLVVDECHRVPATLFTDVVGSFSGHYLLGLSATAFRSDEGLTRLISFYMGDQFHKVDQAELQASGAIVKPSLVRCKTVFRYRYRGDYQPLIAALIKDAARNQQIIDDVVRESRRRNSGIQLLVSDRISHCRIFEDGLKRRGVAVALLIGKTSAEQRAAVVADVQSGRVKVLVATLQLIGEGFDCPGLSNLFLTTPITFEGRLLQVLGRIMRPAKGKQAQVFDYVDEAVSVLKRSAAGRRKILEAL